MKKLITISLLSLFLATPLFSLAATVTSAGLTPKSPFYFLDTLFERINLSLTFNVEKKAKKALEYANERLAEAEEVATEQNTDAVKTALSGYEKNIAFAAEKSKEVKDQVKAETLLTSIADNASKNQEVLSAVLIKVPEEAKQAITQAIEASKKGQEEAVKQISELKQEVAGLKKEIVELKQDNNKNRFNRDINQATEIEKLKKEVSELKNKQSSSVPAQASITLTKPVVEQNPENKGENWLESKIDTYKSMIESMKKTAEGIRNNENISYFKDRRANLVYRLSYAKQLQPMPNESEINGRVSLYWQAFEKDIRDVDNVFSVIESSIALTNRYQEEYERGLSSLLANPKQFVTQEELVKFLESEHSTKFVNRVFEGGENVSKAMQNYLASVDGKEDQYAAMKTTIINMLSYSINRMNAITNYSQPTNTYSNSNYEQARVDQIVREIQENVRALDKTTCTFNSGPSGGFEYSTMICNRSSF